jgi:hypothetical protein
VSDGSAEREMGGDNMPLNEARGVTLKQHSTFEVRR